MADVVDRATRSRMMSGIRGRDTKLEVSVRKALHARGFRYRTGVQEMPGRPDIVLRRWRAVIFVHGCFWHSHDCALFRLPSTRPDFWHKKLTDTVRRDRRSFEALRSLGWRVGVVWECSLRGKGPQGVADVADQLAEWVMKGDSMIELRG